MRIGNDFPTPAPVINPETEAFWAGTLEGKFLIRTCTACKENYWYPRAKCPFCHSFDTEWLESTGKGTIYSYTVNHKAPGEFAASGPSVIAYVELDEGPRVITNIVDCDTDDLAIGTRVEAVFFPAGDDAAIYRFRPIA
ncbi:MAG: Zn-ribbon domain-containing OB-fold protein [Microthrixaceae bacterium]|nr:Zn-ribbon domain-containing OB-fold protein [Microthrixaceae bacterium]